MKSQLLAVFLFTMSVPHWSFVLISQNHSVTRLICFRKKLKKRTYPEIASVLATGFAEVSSLSYHYWERYTSLRHSSCPFSSQTQLVISIRSLFLLQYILLHCFLLVLCVNSWFLLVNCSSSSVFFNIWRSFADRGEILKFVCGPRICLACS